MRRARFPFERSSGLVGHSAWRPFDMNGREARTSRSRMMVWWDVRDVVDVCSLDTLRRVYPYHRLFAVPIRLRRVESLRVALPLGTWMVTTMPGTQQGLDVFRLRFDNASCTPNILNDPHRYSCRCSAGA